MILSLILSQFLLLTILSTIPHRLTINVPFPIVNNNGFNLNTMNLNDSNWSNATVITDTKRTMYWNRDLSWDSDIVVDKDGNIHVVWTDDTDGEWGTDREIMYANFTSSGWSNITVISDLFGWNDGWSVNPRIATDNDGNIHVVWDDDTNGEWGTDREIMYANYTASGWSNATVISDDITGWNNGGSYAPSIATDTNGNIHVVWTEDTDGEWGTDEEIMYVNNTGTGWTNVTLISDDITNWNDGHSEYPDIAVDKNGIVHVVWHDWTTGAWGGGLSDPEIMYANYSASGVSNTIVISDVYGWNDLESLYPKIVTDNNSVIHVIWEDQTIADWEIFYVNFTVSGWSNATVISDDITGWNDGASVAGDIAIDNNDILHVVWADDTDGEWGTDQEIMYTNYTASGWSNATVISDNQTGWNDGSSNNPSITIDNNTGNVHVVWDDNTAGIWGGGVTDTDILHVYKGSGWSNVTAVSDHPFYMGWNDDHSYNPDIAMDNNGVVHVVWHDDTNGEWGTDREIMYANLTATGWSNATVISDDYTNWNDGPSSDPSIAIDNNGNLHVVWWDGTDGEWGTDYEVMYVNNTGAGWSNVTVISDIYGWNDGVSGAPSIAIDENTGTIHVVWQDLTAGEWGTDLEVMYVNYTASGWSNATVISDDYTGWNDGGSNNPQIAVDNNGYQHVVWWDQTNGEWGSDNEILYVNNTGAGWSNVTAISDLFGWNTGGSEYPSIDTDINGSIHVVWEDSTNGEWGTDREVMYTNYTSSGWSNATVVSDDYTHWNTDLSLAPDIAADNSGTLYVVWYDMTDGEWGIDDEIFYINYTSTSGWSNVSVVSEDYTLWNDGGSLNPQIATDNKGNISVVWYDNTDGEWGIDAEIMYSCFEWPIDKIDPNIILTSRNPTNPSNLDTVSVTVHITENRGVDIVLINSNHTGTPINYTMDHLSGTTRDGYWNYTIPSYPAGTTIMYSIWVNDTSNNNATDGPYQYIISDAEDPNIILVSRDPITPNQSDIVNITVHITDNMAVDTVLINTNYTGTPTNYTMDPLSGTAQDGYWNYTIPAYPAGITINYSIWVNDTTNNQDTDGLYQYTISDSEDPNILLVSRDPTSPNQLDTVNITVHITDNLGVDTVLINSNHNGTQTNYTMDPLSGTAQDGYWNYTIPAYPAGITINYSIWVNDTTNNQDTDGPYQYTISDSEDPNILLVSRDPTSPNQLDTVNITVHITDNLGVDTVLFNSNHTGTQTNYTLNLLSGTILDGYWNFTIPVYSAGITITYSIWVNDTTNNQDSDGPYQYTVSDSEDPNIISVSRDPTTPNQLEVVNITVHITDNLGVDTVLINSNHTGTPTYYTMDLLSGTILDGYWNFTIPVSPIGTRIAYSIWVNDTYDNDYTAGPYQYVVIAPEPGPEEFILPLPGTSTDDNILKSLMSPIGLVILGVVAAASLIAGIMITKRGTKSETKKIKKEPKGKMSKKGPNSHLPLKDKTDKSD